jgi:hypothetical protein
MLKIIGNDIMRNGKKVGWIESNHIISNDGKKIGYFEGNFVFNALGHKLGYIEGDYFYSQDSRENKVHLEKINEGITEGVVSEICKCAIYMLIGV